MVVIEMVSGFTRSLKRVGVWTDGTANLIHKFSLKRQRR